MPIYEYRCDSCEHEFERFLRARDEEPESCPECSESTVSRLISDTSFQLKGSGWYETDYARNDEEELEPDVEPENEGTDDGAGQDDSEN